VAALWFTIGAGAVVVALLGLARSRGTDAAGLWDAVVTFRWDASRVIATESSAATGERAGGLAAAFVGTGAPLVLLLLALLPWRPHRAADPAGVALTWAAVVLLVWEGFSAAVGGSYWLHYLIGLVPGLVLLLALALRALAPAPGAEAAGTTGAARAAGTTWVRRRRTAGAVLVALALAVVPVSTVAARVGVGLTPSGRPADEQAVIDFVRSHDDRARTGVVAFGGADVLRAAGLTSPYPYLWSLPVRVRDPGLLALDAVLRGTRRPSWILRQGASLDSWGIEATAADRIIGRRYRRVFTSGDWQVLELRPD
jgi:hypothetical protein